jgi:short-subunit dehydrogenase
MDAPAYALVTGASKGLGKFFARALAARKQNLVLVARGPAKLDALAAELRAAHAVQVEPLVFDLAAPQAGQRLAAELRARKLHIDLLVNNAGFGLRGEFRQMSLAEQLNMIQLHDTTAVELTYELLPAMIEAGGGRIINVSSMAGFQPVPYAALYSATKSFLTNFSMALREELRAVNVKIVTVCPGRLQPDPDESQAGRSKVPGGEQAQAEVVAETLRKLDAGGGLVIPGRRNRWMQFGQRLLPPNAVPKIVAKKSKP